jgi:hypothetical protein
MLRRSWPVNDGDAAALSSEDRTGFLELGCQPPAPQRHQVAQEPFHDLEAVIRQMALEKARRLGLGLGEQQRLSVWFQEFKPRFAASSEASVPAPRFARIAREKLLCTDLLCYRWISVEWEPPLLRSPL